MSAGSRYVPPAPGMMPRRVSGRATTALLLKTRRCVVRASSRPPPKASEETAEMVGTGSWVMELKAPRSLERKSAVLFDARRGVSVCFWCQSNIGRAGWVADSSWVNVARSFRSAPAQKLVSTSLAMMRARVEELAPTWWIALT